MASIGSIALCVIFLLVVAAFGVSWRLALALLLLGPLIADFIVLTGGIVIGLANGELRDLSIDLSIGRILPLAFMFYSLTLACEIFPIGLIQAGAVIVTGATFRRQLDSVFVGNYSRIILGGAALGTVIGGISALVIYLCLILPDEQLHTDSLYSYQGALPTIVLIGTVDGMLAMMLGRRDKGLANVAGSHTQGISPS
jgi:hypothetical protein